MASSIYLNGIGVALGDAKPIEELAELQADPERLREFRQVGFRHYLASNETVAQLTKRTLVDLLGRSGVAPASIDALIYCSQTLQDEAYFAEVNHVLDQLGLVNAYPIGIHFAYCGNLGSALRVAHSLLACGEAERVIVLTVDTIRSDVRDARFLEPSVAVFSDGAAACILQADEPSPLKVVGGVTQLVDYGLSRVTLKSVYRRRESMSKEYLAYALANCRGRKRAAQRHFSRCELTAKDFRFVVPNNFGNTTMAALAVDIGINPLSVFDGNVASNGHVSSADPLINLRTLTDGVMSPGDRALLFSTGPYTWTYFSVEQL